MSAGKVGILICYAVLALLAVTQSDSGLGVWSLRILILLAVVHLVEVVVFFKLCQRAGGSLGVHLLNVFLFGVFHANELKAASGEG
ncbi:MAG: hypothetical protein AAGA91_12305 [Pseudomonadota bacterium]